MNKPLIIAGPDPSTKLQSGTTSLSIPSVQLTIGDARKNLWDTPQSQSYFQALVAPSFPNTLPVPPQVLFVGRRRFEPIASTNARLREVAIGQVNCLLHCNAPC
jgi:hypothetical protein